MKASRASYFLPTKAISLALSCGFICGQVVLANPDSSKVDAGKGAAAAKGAEEDSSKPNSDAENSQKLNSGGEKPRATINRVRSKSSQSVDKSDVTNAEQSATSSSADDQSSKASLKAVDEADKPVDEKSADAGSKSSRTESGEAVINRKENEDKLHALGVLHWNLSKKYAKDGDLDLAQTELDLAVMNWPDMKVAHRDLCMLSLMRFNFLRSIAEFMMTVGLGDAEPLNEDESSKLLENAMTLHYKKGLVYARQQNWPKTVNELELAAHLISDDFAVHRALAFAYANIGRWDKAEEHYKTTFELSPHDGSSRADLAYFLQKSGKINEAQKEMEEAVKSQPKAAAYHVDLSCMAESRGDLDTASKELKEAVSLSPTHADLWTHLGRVLERKGDNTEAVDAYTKALTIDPSQTYAKTALNKLQASDQAPAIPNDAAQDNAKSSAHPATSSG